MLDSVFSPVKGELSSIKKGVESGKNVCVFCGCENARYHVASFCGKPFIYIVSDLVAARRAYERIREYGDGTVALLPEREDVLIARKATDYSLLYERLSCLKGLSDGKLSLIVTVDSLLQKYPKKCLLDSHIIKIKIGDKIDTYDLAEKLISAGYENVGATEKATFGIRGDTIDVWDVGSDRPVRIMLFDSEVEQIRVLAPDTMLSEGTGEEVVFYPATDIFLSAENAKKVAVAATRAKKSAEPEAAKVLGEGIEKLLQNPSSPLNTYFLPFCDEYFDRIYDHLPKDGMIVLDDSRQIEDKLKLVRNSFCARVEAMQKNRLLSAHTEAIWSANALYDFPRQVLGFDKLTGRTAMYRPQEIYNLHALALPAFYNDMEGFFERVRQQTISGVKTRVYVASEGAEAALREAFVAHDIGVQENTEDALLSLIVGNVSYGFSYPADKLMCVGINDVSRKTVASHKSAARKRVVFELPEKGDYVVHERYGIGISEGMQRVKTSSGEKDFYVVLYRDGDRLYLPAEQLNTLEKYSGSDKPTLHRLGGTEFEKVKKRIRESVHEMAFDLLKLYRARHNKEGHVYQPDTVWQKEMEDDFEFTETEDQLAAIRDIKADMESGKIMDRLLCGDVGYGKTEVAIRAIFKTVIENKQAAFLAPTTILAQQHYNLLCARFNKYKIKIALLSRFVPPAEQKKSLEKIASGEISVVVATHRLLGDDVVFHDLGLLVLDEEQRFGVEQKEKMKLFRNTVNILSLSATPIPRTLHMALSGIRDISVLETPPKERLPVETYVTEYNDELLKDAVNKELARDGQVFILYNHVEGIERFYAHVCNLLGDVPVAYAHGRMDENLLEDRIRDFYEGKARVLVSTTIIENGVDLPNANTIFVLDADRLGLSQMYQLRGRVGRRNVLAYAYFTVPEGKVLTSNAIKRLEAVMDNTQLGSGFGIAMRDLEIRGAGNVLGKQQHGQMEKVGYEMYLKLVKEGIDEMQGKTVDPEKEATLRVDGNFSLDDDFIPDQKSRVAFYKTVATLSSVEEGRAYFRHLKECYGQPPANTEGIIKIAIMKNLAQRAGVKEVRIGQKICDIRFYNGSCLTSERLFEAMEKYKTRALLNPSNPPSVTFSCGQLTMNQKINMILLFLSAL